MYVVTSSIPPQCGCSCCLVGVIEYSIKIVEDTYESVRKRKEELVEQLQRFWALPTGMTVEEFEPFWKSGLGTGRATEAKFNPERFKSTPGSFVRSIRYMARQSAVESLRLQKEEKGKKRVVWGRDDKDLEEWERDVIDEGLELRQKEEEQKQHEASLSSLAAATGEDLMPESDLHTDPPLHPTLRLSHLPGGCELPVPNVHAIQPKRVLGKARSSPLSDDGRPRKLLVINMNVAPQTALKPLWQLFQPGPIIRP